MARLLCCCRREVGRSGPGATGRFADLAGSAIIGSMVDWIEHFRTALPGLTVSHVWRGYGSALFTELGVLTPRVRRDGGPGEPRGEISLMIEWSWRIEDERTIICGSWSDEALWRPSFDRLLGREIEGLVTFGRLPEVSLTLSGDLLVTSFMTAEGDPAWTLFDCRGNKPITVCCRSGRIVAET
jgi:hypothetical protein